MSVTIVFREKSWILDQFLKKNFPLLVLSFPVNLVVEVVVNIIEIL